MASNFIAVVYATLKDKGIDTSKMSTDEAIAKYNEIRGNGEKASPTAQREKLANKFDDSGKDGYSLQSTYRIDFSSFDDDIDWDIAEENEKANANKGKSTARKDKYGNPLVSDEAFAVGVRAVKDYIQYMGESHEELKRSNVYTSALESIVSKAITEAGYNRSGDITETDIEEIIGAGTGEEYNYNADTSGAGYRKWQGKQYQGYTPKK